MAFRLPRIPATHVRREQESIASSTNEPPESVHPKPHSAPDGAPATDPGQGADPAAAISQAAIEGVHNSPEFAQLRTTFRRFAFPMTAVFVVWYFLFVLLSTYAHDFMSMPFIGNVNVGLAMGLGQFVTTFLITWLYVRHANRNIDPLAARLRTDLEGGSSHANG